MTRVGRRGRSPLHRALEPDWNTGYQNVDEDAVLAIVALLVDAGADVNALTTDASANTPLDILPAALDHGGFPSERVEDYLRLNGALHSRDLQESGTTRDALETAGRLENDVPLLILSARAYETAGRYEAAADAIYRALQVDRGKASRLEPGMADWLSNLSYHLNMEAQYEHGVRAADAAIELDPSHAYAHGNRAFALGQLDRGAEALVAARAAVERLDDDPATWAILGYAHNLVGAFPQSIAAFDRALTLEPLYFETLDGERETQQEALRASRRGQRYRP